MGTKKEKGQFIKNMIEIERRRKQTEKRHTETEAGVDRETLVHQVCTGKTKERFLSSGVLLILVISYL